MLPEALARQFRQTREAVEKVSQRELARPDVVRELDALFGALHNRLKASKQLGEWSVVRKIRHAHRLENADIGDIEEGGAIRFCSRLREHSLSEILAPHRRSQIAERYPPYFVVFATLELWPRGSLSVESSYLERGDDFVVRRRLCDLLTYITFAAIDYSQFDAAELGGLTTQQLASLMKVRRMIGARHANTARSLGGVASVLLWPGSASSWEKVSPDSKGAEKLFSTLLEKGLPALAEPYNSITQLSINRLFGGRDVFQLTDTPWPSGAKSDGFVRTVCPILTESDKFKYDSELLRKSLRRRV